MTDMTFDNADADQRVQRQSSIETSPNPETHGDYLCLLSGTLATTIGKGEATVTLRYVPDKWLLKPDIFARYLARIPATEDRMLEETAHTMLDDLNNQLVARWLQIVLDVAHPDAARPLHRVLLEDRQPQWDNPSLLARVKAF